MSRRWRYMGAFAEWLGIRPWEMDLLTEAQFTSLIDYLEAKNKEQ